MVNYPEVVTLAGLLAAEQWRGIASADRRRDRVRFDREVARRLALSATGFQATDPLVAWQESEALLRRQRLHNDPGCRGPEVPLSQPDDLRFNLTTRRPAPARAQSGVRPPRGLMVR